MKFLLVREHLSLKLPELVSFLTVSSGFSWQRFLDRKLGLDLTYLYQDNIHNLKIFEKTMAVKLTCPSVIYIFATNKSREIT